jgi:hypothetical protein
MGEEGRRCRCYERQRAKALEETEASHTRWNHQLIAPVIQPVIQPASIHVLNFLFFQAGSYVRVQNAFVEFEHESEQRR